MYNDVQLINYEDYLVYKKEFIDLNDFLLNIKDENINPIFKNTFASKTGDYSFTETDSYETAWNLCRFTMDEGFNQFMHNFNKLKYEIVYFNKLTNNYSPVGFSPSVPRYLLGIPTTMINHKLEKNDATINIYMNLAYNCYEGRKQIENRGLIVLYLVDFLEKKGFKVNLNTYELSRVQDEICFIIIPLKRYYEKINFKKLYFPIVHPSFLRRLLFRAKEKMPLKNYNWSYGYGETMKYDCVTNFLKFYEQEFNKNSVIYISTPSEMNIKGNSLVEDFKNFITIINSKYDVTEEKIKQYKYK